MQAIRGGKKSNLNGLAKEDVLLKMCRQPNRFAALVQLKVTTVHKNQPILKNQCCKQAIKFIVYKGASKMSRVVSKYLHETHTFAAVSYKIVTKSPRTFASCITVLHSELEINDFFFTFLYISSN